MQPNLCFIFLLILIGSCSTPSQSSQNNSGLQSKSNKSSIKTDSTLFLNFPSGIRAILEDSKGNIWFGSYQEGVCLFDGTALIYFTTEDGLSDKQVRSIFEDSNGTVWFECGQGISSYDGERIITQTLKNYQVKQDWKIEKNDLWFKGDESIGYNATEGQFGVYRYDGNTFNYLAFPLTFKEGEYSSHSISTPFIKGKNGMIWFGTYGAVIGYDGSSFTVIDNKSLGFNEEKGGLHVRSIFEDSKGNLWIGNNGIGVLFYDGKTSINFSESNGLISQNSQLRGGYKSPSKSLEHVFAIGEDSSGNIWFGDRDTGAWRYDGKAMKNYAKNEGLSTTHIWQIYNTKQGELWFAMADGSVMQFNKTYFERIF